MNPSLMVGAGVLLVMTAGCTRTSDVPISAPAATRTAPALDDPAAKRWEQLQEQLKAANPEYNAEQTAFREGDGRITMAEFNEANLRDISPIAGLPLKFVSFKACPISDLSPLRGMPLEEVALEDTAVTDLSPLAESPIATLWLNNAPVTNLKPIAGLPLTSLNLLGTKVSDITPLTGMPLESLWLNETEVVDLSPLADCPLVSLTLHKTPVRDISVVRRLPSLQRLHIGETEVTDLRPLAGLRLTRLIFTPAKITDGMDVVRQMDTLQELDVEFREPKRWTPDEFWRQYDAGALK